MPRKSRSIEVSCPHCKKKFDYYSCEFRPFCCERCKMIDLGMWFNESYALASKENLEESDLDEVVKFHGEKQNENE